MAINKKLISFATEAQFDAYLANNNIDPRSIVFIEETKRIWTHGVFFDTSWNYVTGKPTTFTPSAHTLGSHSDVTITSNTSGEILKWNGTKWINNTLAEAGIATTLDITTAINNLEIGGRNLLLNSGVPVTNSNYPTKVYDLSPIGQTLVDGEDVTVVIKGSLGAGKSYFKLYNSGGSVSSAGAIIYPSEFIDGIAIKTFKWSKLTASNTTLYVYPILSTVTVDSTIEWIKLVRGNKTSRDWTPAPEDQVSDWNTTDVDSFSYIKNKPSTFTPSAHTHNASDINVGVLGIARIPTGTTSTTVALGNHTHSYLPLSGGTLTGAVTGTTMSLTGIDLLVSGTRCISYYGPATNGYLTQMQTTSTTGYGTHGAVTGDWALYNKFSGTTNRGWIWQLASVNVASISGTGAATFNGSVTAPTFIGNASSATALTTLNVGSITNPIYFSSGKPVASTYSFGNASGNIPISNGTLNTNLNADLLDGYHPNQASVAATIAVRDSNRAISMLSVKYSSIFINISTQGWYRVYSGYGSVENVIINIARNYHTTNDESYSFSISKAYNSSPSIVQISGRANTRLITYIRVDYTTSAMYIDFFYNSNNINGIYISGSGRSDFQSPTLVLTPSGAVTEFATVNGVGSNFGFTGALTGNADSATKLQTARTIAGVSFNGTENIAIPFANLSSKPNTLAGYGITDAYTKVQVDTSLNGKVSKTGDTMTGNLSIIETKNILLRPNLASYYSGIGYDTSGNECIALWAKNTVTRLRWHAGLDLTNLSSGSMMSITPDFEISKASGIATGYIGGKVILHSGNYNSYSPSKTGTGASGTWGISITGNAATATTATTASTASTATKVSNKLILKFDTGTTENINLYTYDGSAAKTINITAGSNVSLTKAANTITINATDTTYSTGTLAQLNAGTDTTGRLQTAKLLNDWLTNKFQVVTELPASPIIGVFYFVKE